MYGNLPYSQQIVKEVNIWAEHWRIEKNISELREYTEYTLKQLNELLNNLEIWEKEYNDSNTLGIKEIITEKKLESVSNVAGDVIKIIAAYKGLQDKINNKIGLVKQLEDEINSLKNLKFINEKEMKPIYENIKKAINDNSLINKKDAKNREIRGLIIAFFLGILTSVPRQLQFPLLDCN